ncbi:hypothetical protein BGX24_006526, partial [Mortierella sp. AD032]
MQNIRLHLQAIRPIHFRSKVLPHLKGSGIKLMELGKIAEVHNAVMDVVVVVVDNPLTYTEPVSRTQEALYDAMAAINNKLAIQVMVPTGLGEKDMDDALFGLGTQSLNETNRGSYSSVYNRVGNLLSYGEGGTEFDFSSAVKWYRRAADQDGPQGQYNVTK